MATFKQKTMKKLTKSNEEGTYAFKITHTPNSGTVLANWLVVVCCG